MRKLTTLMLVLLGTGLVYADHDDGPGRYATPGYGYGGNEDIARAAHHMEYAAERFHQQLRYSTHRERGQGCEAAGQGGAGVPPGSREGPQLSPHAR